jgi:hypothetical protein
MHIRMIMSAAGLALAALSGPAALASTASQYDRSHSDRLRRDFRSERADRRDGSGPDHGYRNGQRVRRERYDRRCDTAFRKHRRASRCR